MAAFVLGPLYPSQGRTPNGLLGARPRVGAEVDLLEAFAGEVRVHLRGRDVGVAEHLLDGPQVAAAGEQMGGEAVAERVRAHLAGEPRRRGRGAGRSCRAPGASAAHRGS